MMISLAMWMMKAIMGFPRLPGFRLKPKNFICHTLATLTVSFLLAIGALSASGAVDSSGELFFPSDDPMAELERTRQSALANDRLVLVIMGANWCHDSRALASRIYQEPLRPIIESHYETLFVDVGYLDQGSEVIKALGPPVYYATPTVLIIEPASGRLVNEKNRHQWGSADSISMEDSVAYFALMATPGPAAIEGENPTGTELQNLQDEIDAFELAQAERLYAAYAVIGPMLQDYKEGDPPAEFDDYWNEVRAFRMQVPGDVDELRQEARERAAAGEQHIQLSYPQYVAFSWETSK
jgi:hypothetical protein